jgi:predicted GIY-YIG superfamily endonuclease
VKRNIGQLVCQHLENVSREALKKYQDIIKNYVRRRHGIYALFRKNRLYYVGLASNLRNRLKHHLKDRHAQTWDRFSVYLTIKDEHLHELEALVLRIAVPRGNRQSGKFIRSQDLRPEFKRAINKYHQKEMKSIFGQQERVSEKIEKVKIKDGKQPVLAPYVKKRFQIRFRYKNKLHKAMVRKDGTISYKGKIYNSPSLAAASVMGHAANGWNVWQYERAPGDWVLLNEMRKK